MKKIYAAALLSIVSAGPVLADQVAEGRQLSKEHCARCHVIGDGNRMNSIGSTPSFPRLVNNFEDWEARFSSFYARRPHPAFVRVEGLALETELPPNAAPIALTVEQSLAILRYAESLAKN